MLRWTLKDYDGENTNTRIRTTPLTAANFDAQMTLMTTFQAALAPMVRGSSQSYVIGNETDDSLASPNDVWAQRELKWRVNYHDNVTGEGRHFTIGTADVEMLSPTNKGHAYIGDGADVDAFIAALEAFMISEDGNTITVDDIILLGANT